MSTLADHAYPVDELVADDLPAITSHRSRYGRYLRCEGCGAEVAAGAEGLLHDEDCARRRTWR